MRINRAHIAALGTFAAAFIIAATPADARGCNGVVNQLQWGCAAWDNNNGPQFPYYRPPVRNPNVKVGIPTQHAQRITFRGKPAVKDKRTGVVYEVVRVNGSDVVSAGGLNLVAGGRVVSAGGLN